VATTNCLDFLAMGASVRVGGCVGIRSSRQHREQAVSRQRAAVLYGLHQNKGGSGIAERVSTLSGMSMPFAPTVIDSPRTVMDPRRQARSLYFQGWGVTAIAEYIGQARSTVEAWKQ